MFTTKVTPLIAGNPSQVSEANVEHLNSNTAGLPDRRAKVFVAGSLAIDLACDFIPKSVSKNRHSLQLQTSNPAVISQALGGVGHNVATAIHYLDIDVQLCSVIGDDQAGAIARKMLIEKGLFKSGAIVQKQSARTAQYVAVNDGEKNLVLAMADMDILQGRQVEIDTIWKFHLDSQKPEWLVIDANWDTRALQRWLTYGKSAGAKIAFEPVSVAKAQRMFTTSPNSNFELGVLPHHAVSLATPNSLELASMHTAAREAGQFERDDWWQVIDAMKLPSSGSRDKLSFITQAALVDEGIPQQSIQLLPFIPTILTKLGSNGVLMTQVLKPGDDRLTSTAHSSYILSRADVDHSTIGGVYMRLFPPAEKIPASDIISVNGVGDTFLGITIAGLAKDNPKTLIDLIQIAQQGSVTTLMSKEAVSPEIKNLRTLL